MTLFDIIIFTIGIGSGLLGLHAGIIKLSLKFLGFILSIILACAAYPLAKDIASEYSKNELVTSISSGIISYITFLIICTIVTSKLLTILSPIRGGSIDRTIGLIVGIARGLFICIIIYLMIAIFLSSSYLKSKNLDGMIQNTNEAEYPEWLKKSLSYFYVDMMSKFIIDIIPKTLLESIILPQKNKIDETNKVFINDQEHKDDENQKKPTNIENILRKELDELLQEKS